jgi:hypothetical protein
VSELADVASLIVAPVNKLQIRLKYPHYWTVERVQREEVLREEDVPVCWVRFYHSARLRTRAATPLQPAAPPPAPPTTIAVPRPSLKLKLGGKPNATPLIGATTSISLPSPARAAAPTLLGTPTTSAPPSHRLNSLAVEGGLQSPLVKHSPSPVPPSIPTPVQAKPPTISIPPPISVKPPQIRATPSPRPSPAPLPPTQTSTQTPMEGVESTASTPRALPTVPPPISQPSPAPSLPAPVPSKPAAVPAKPAPATPLLPSKPKISIKLGAAKTSSVPKPTPSKPSSKLKTKKTKIVKFHLPSEKLAAIRDRTPQPEPKNGGIKRKAVGALAEQQRPAKRQSVEPTGVNGAKKPKVTAEKKADSFLVKVFFGKGRLGKAPERK